MKGGDTVEKKDFYKISDIVKMIGVSRQAVAKQIQVGNLKAFKFGNRWRIEKKDFEAYKEARKSK